jgi:predicted transcriptional regulator
LSIRPHWLDKIVSGEKTVEIRRRGPALDMWNGRRVLFWETGKNARLAYMATVERIDAMSPADLWSAHKEGVGMDRATFDAYLDGNPRRPVAIVLRDLRSVGPFTREAVGKCLFPGTCGPWVHSHGKLSGSACFMALGSGRRSRGGTWTLTRSTRWLAPQGWAALSGWMPRKQGECP